MNFLFLLFSVFSFANPVTITPNFQGRAFLALRQSDLAIPPEQRVAVVVERASLICHYAQEPKGRFRQRKAGAIQTMRVARDGAEVAILERKGQSLQARIIRVPPGEPSEVFRGFRCLGIR